MIRGHQSICLKGAAIKNKSFKEKTIPVFIFIAFGYFLFRLLYFATHISFGVPPDEVTHFGICQIFSKAFFLPKKFRRDLLPGVGNQCSLSLLLYHGKTSEPEFFPSSRFNLSALFKLYARICHGDLRLSLDAVDYLRPSLALTLCHFYNEHADVQLFGSFGKL